MSRRNALVPHFAALVAIVLGCTPQERTRQGKKDPTRKKRDADAVSEGREEMVADERAEEPVQGSRRKPIVENEEAGAADGVLCEPPQDISQLAAMLPERAAGFGRTIDDRDAWASVFPAEVTKSVISRAERILGEALVETTDELYLDFSKTGNRRRWEHVAGQRRDRVKWLTLAECLEDKGRFVETLEETMRALCAERTWVMPAHDRSLSNFHGTSIDIDLGSAHLGGTLATALYLLADRMSVQTRAAVKADIERRITTPFREMAMLKRAPCWWMLGTNNWNSVCLAGITVAALATLDSREDRAFIIGAAARFSHNFLKGFTADGYCTEGVGYWGYGFGNYVTLAEAILQATGGRVDLMARPEARLPALYGSKIEIIGGVCPAFADCGVDARPSASVMWYVNRRLGLGLERYNELAMSSDGHVYEAVMRAFPNSASRAQPTDAKALTPDIRDWFDHAGVLLCRPTRGSDSRFAVAMKGGNNAEHHNHNDVGSFTVVVGKRPVLLDPGGEVYTSRTFSHQRYESKVLNSYGHPVPLVADQLQRQGADAAGRVLKAEFTDALDTLQLDISSAYEVKELESLRRTFEYSRVGGGVLIVRDEVSFSKPMPFATALVTLGACAEREDGSLFIHDFDEAVEVKLDVDGGEYDLTQERIDEDVKTPTLPLRICVKMKQPVRRASVTFTITSVEPEEGPARMALRDGGFELDGWGWRIPSDGISSVSEERAAGGKRSLKISDAKKDSGSNVTSARVGVKRIGAYVLEGKACTVSGGGLGMYVKCYDAADRLLTQHDERDNIPSIGTLGGSRNEWEDFSFEFETPPGTAYLEVWIHSYNAALVEAYLDDLAIRAR